MNFSALHSLPFSISYDGVAEVNSAFPITAIENNTYESAFRGRKLIGRSSSISPSLNVTIGHLNDMKNELVIENSAQISSDIKIFEWNKADLPEMPKLFISEFENLNSIQEKVKIFLLWPCTDFLDQFIIRLK